jgi:hypothetical protein
VFPVVEPSQIVRVHFEGRDLLVGVNDHGICAVVEGRAVIEPGDQVEFIERLTRFMNFQTRREPGQ